MDRTTAIKTLVATAYCSTIDLLCEDCPLYDEENHKCLGYSDDDVIEAAKILKGELSNNEP